MALTIEKKDGGIVLSHEGSPIALYYMKQGEGTSPGQRGHILVMEVKDTGDSCFQFALDTFKLLRSGATDTLPLVR